MTQLSQPSGRPRQSRQHAWRGIIQMGEQLLAFVQEASKGRKTPQQVFEAQQDLIVKTAAKLLKGEVRLWVEQDTTDKEGIAINPPSWVETSISTKKPGETLSLTPLMEEAMAAGEVCCLPSPGTQSETIEPTIIAAAAPLAFQAAHLTTSEDRVIGVLQVERKNGRPFKETEIDLLDGLAVQAALALQALDQVAIEQWRIQQLSLVSQVSAQIAQVRDLDELSTKITQLILETFDYYYVALFTCDPGQDMLHFRASAGPHREGGAHSSDASTYSPVHSIHLGQGITGMVAETGERILAADVSHEPRYRYSDVLPETRSELALPLRIEERVLGVLDVQSDQPNAFDETDLLVLTALVHSIAVAVEGARLYSALRQRAEQLSAVSEVSNAITSILDQDELLSEVVQLIHNRFGYPFIHLFTVHTGRRKIFYEAGIGAAREKLQEEGFYYDLDDPDGIVPWVARQGETVLANDVESEPRYRPSTLPPDETRSELTVPLVFGGEVLGVLDVQSDQPYAFGEEDRFLFEALADNIAVAIRNAYLYRSESWRRQASDSLREVAGLLSADADLDQVLDSILIELERTLPCDLAAIWLLDEEREKDEAGDLPLKLAAVRGSEASALALKIGTDLDEIVQLHAHFLGQAQFTDWLAEAVNSNEPEIRSPESPFEPLGAIMGYPPDYSAVATPLRVGEQRLGVLTLVHRSPGRYGSEARAMTAAFASYAAVAIENTRLYEAAHEQAWVSTVLLQVTEATQTISSLNELLATVVGITPMLVGVRACAIYLLDDDEVFIPAAAAGLSPQQQAEFERWRFAPGDVAALDQVYQTKQPIILDSETEDPRLSEVLFAGPEENVLLDAELVVLAPLLAHGEVMGVLLVDYSNGVLADRFDLHFSERLAIIQGIAHQTSIAVENIRLLKAQKEEAYVSVALLQVAQAVVSTNGLEDILGAIVRITPILVGVKRALIYLWDPELSVFWLAQSYGVPRSSGSRIYAPGEFPLLDLACETDRLVARPLDPEENGAEPPEAWAHLPAPDQSEIEGYLEKEPCLLLAFPLSVKGEILGVLLVQEPDPLGVESVSGGANRRLREKRLEITTGISQQAALAIQNDRLQKEMVERERLEREMQLAREIQRTFLPHQMPDLAGWELDVRWRTARQVGGDFYDYIEFPDGRLGLLIADVADKGMPAALFMTLVRTLVRATVQQIASPAEILKRVNDVLVPDAQQGMFVTLFYAVLDLQSGALTYANAGHNPPILYHHASGQTELLPRTGMALGVQEENNLLEKTVQLAPQDFLLMYTDGVTESFSPDGQMYDDERLMEVVLQANAPTAKALLDAVEESVTRFVTETHFADDLTLMVLRRKFTASEK